MEKIIYLGIEAQEGSTYRRPKRDVTRQEFKVQRTKEIRVGERVALAEATLSVQAEQIALTAKQTDLTAVDNRLVTAESTIIVHANQITLKASQSSLDITNGKVATAEASIITQAGQIALKVSTTDYTGATIASKINLEPTSIKISAGHIQLEGIVTVNSYFKINTDGTMVATGGQIGGWGILSDRILGNGVGISSSSSLHAFWSGETNGQAGGGGTNALFRVGNDGHLYATQATISGDITATSGTFTGTIYAGNGRIAGWYVGSSSLYKGGITLDSANERIYIGSTYLYEHSSSILGISGILRITSGIYCYSTANFYDILPLANGTYTLGTSTLRWADIWCSDSALNGSDIRLKKDIQPIEKGVDLILGLRPVQYRWKREGSTRPHYGLIANEVKSKMDELGIDSGLYADPKMAKDYDKMEDPKGLLALRYTELIAPMIQTIQSLDARLKVVEGRA